MTQDKAAAKPRTAKKAQDPAPVMQIVPSSPIPVTLERLRRAPENVRHIRIDEDVVGLADDIAVHGLLSSLIGYEASWPDDGDRVFVVGGGRRLQALELLRARGAIADDFTVPVLIRDVEMAVELSLSENLQQRTMSPVDEFHAFKALMDTGRHSPAELAKRFGFTERVVKQRLRLADLAAPVLDALANRQITLDAAQAYASVQDKARQEKVFKSHAKASSVWSHQPSHIRNDLNRDAITTAHALFKFVGADSYQRRGGDYEDDLFSDVGPDRVLRDPTILETAAKEMIDFQSARLLADLRKSDDWAPTISGYVVTPHMQLQSWGVGHDMRPKPPAGYGVVDRWDEKSIWRTVRNNGVDVRVLVGVNPEGELVAWPRIVYVEQAQLQAVDPRVASAAHPVETPEQIVARERAEGVEKFAFRRAVGPFAGTRFEGRAFWTEGWRGHPEKTARDGIPGWLVPVRIFVTDAEVAASLADAEQDYDEDLAAAARAAAEAQEREQAIAADAARRSTELAKMSPPAVVVIDGEVWLRSDDASYAPLSDDSNFVDDWATLLDHFDGDAIDATYATREAFDDAMAKATAGRAMAEAAE